jgi:glycosyltransferase involved in cell wall biosynthesis
MAASYSVSHNRAALDFVLEQVWPRLRQAAPQTFHLHILGTKLPRAYYERYAAPDLHLHGFVDDLEGFLDSMDIALTPSPFGQGMQQKIFEPLCRGFPTITHRRGLAGYPYTDGESVLVGADAEDYVRQLLRLRDPALRSKLAASASAVSASLFSQAALLERVQSLLTALQNLKI